jgi:hypothetical protein
MKNQVDIGTECLFQPLGVAHVHFDEIELPGFAMLREKVEAAAAQIVEHRYLMPGAHQSIDKIGADEASASGDDDVHRASQFASDFVVRNHSPKVTWGAPRIFP